MNFTIPFTEESVKAELCGRIFVQGLKQVGTHRVNKIHESLELKSEDCPEGLNWKVEDGCLYLLDEKDSVIAEINAVEVSNNQLFLSGEVYGMVGQKPARMLMYERRELGTDFFIVVSSHVDYEADTVPRLLRSLRKEGIPEDRIAVVVSGVTDEEEPIERNYHRIPVKDNLMGCTGLLPLLDGSLKTKMSYVLLLHDTCEAIPGFESKIKQTDVGLPYDLIESINEIGLWSMDFIRRLSEIQGFDAVKGPTYELYGSIKELCSLSCRGVMPKSLRSKDVYGTGVKREVKEILELSLKKYSGRKQTGGRP